MATQTTRRRRLAQVTLRIDESRHGHRLDDVLLAWLPMAVAHDFGKPVVRRLIVAGTIRLNGRPVRTSAATVGRGDLLRAAIDVSRLPPPRQESHWQVARADILYRDAWLLAINKPAGLPTVPTVDPTRPSAVEAVRAYLARGTAPPATRSDGGEPPYVAVHQRLDRDTTGVLVFAIHPDANAGLARQFASQTAAKIYHALTVRPPLDAAVPDMWVATAPLEPHRRTARDRPVPDAAGAVPATTTIRVLERLSQALLVEARPRTGRKHQVRAHLASSDVPILGDVRYGGTTTFESERVERVMLHAAELSIEHPVTGVRLRLQAPYAADMAELHERARRHAHRRPRGPA